MFSNEKQNHTVMNILIFTGKLGPMELLIRGIRAAVKPCRFYPINSLYTKPCLIFIPKIMMVIQNYIRKGIVET